jgi:hypothetical protein
MTQADCVHSTPRRTASKSNPTDQPTTRDDEFGMAWWNNLTERERGHWASLASTGRAVDAWDAFKRGTDQTPPIDQARRRFLAVATGASVASVGTLAVAAAMPAAAPYSAACAVDLAVELEACERRSKSALFWRHVNLHLRGLTPVADCPGSP